MEDIVVYKIKDLMKIFGFGKTKMHQFIKTGELPCVKIGGEYCITKERLNKWFEEKEFEEIYIN